MTLRPAPFAAPAAAVLLALALAGCSAQAGPDAAAGPATGQQSSTTGSATPDASSAATEDTAATDSCSVLRAADLESVLGAAVETYAVSDDMGGSGCTATTAASSDLEAEDWMVTKGSVTFAHIIDAATIDMMCTGLSGDSVTEVSGLGDSATYAEAAEDGTWMTSDSSTLAVRSGDACDFLWVVRLPDKKADPLGQTATVDLFRQLTAGTTGS